jgi:hypothetical protein
MERIYEVKWDNFIYIRNLQPKLIHRIDSRRRGKGEKKCSLCKGLLINEKSLKNFWQGLLKRAQWKQKRFGRVAKSDGGGSKMSKQSELGDLPACT